MCWYQYADSKWIVKETYSLGSDRVREILGVPSSILARTYSSAPVLSSRVEDFQSAPHGH